MGQMDLTAINGIIDELELWYKPLPIKELQKEIAVLTKKFQYWPSLRYVLKTILAVQSII